jgi:hypothetical protein
VPAGFWVVHGVGPSRLTKGLRRTLHRSPASIRPDETNGIAANALGVMGTTAVQNDSLEGFSFVIPRRLG